jgi:hypothetical protein
LNPSDETRANARRYDVADAWAFTLASLLLFVAIVASLWSATHAAPPELLPVIVIEAPPP